MIARALACGDGELLQLSRSLDGIERDRNRQFEELRIPVEDDDPTCGGED